MIKVIVDAKIPVLKRAFIVLPPMLGYDSVTPVQDTVLNTAFRTSNVRMAYERAYDIQNMMKLPEEAGRFTHSDILMSNTIVALFESLIDTP